jgi:hypothetical protein
MTPTYHGYKKKWPQADVLRSQPIRSGAPNTTLLSSSWFRGFSRVCDFFDLSRFRTPPDVVQPFSQTVILSEAPHPPVV